MPCVHLQQLYKVCHEHDLKFSSSDLIRIICPHCGEVEVCPSTLSDEYDAKQTVAVGGSGLEAKEAGAGDKAAR